MTVDQGWFWTGPWQQREREVDTHVKAGRLAVHEDGEAFLRYLRKLDEDRA